MIEPVFERLAEEKGLQGGQNGAGFAKIDIHVGLGNSLASEWNVRTTPTFIFFLDGKKVCTISDHCLPCILIRSRLQLDELKEANANELRTQIDLLLFQAFPRELFTNRIKLSVELIWMLFSTPSHFYTDACRSGLVIEPHHLFSGPSH